MKISWVFAAGYALDPAYDIEQLKKVGPGWGSWKTWRSCGIDNVICHELKKCQELVQRNFHITCNFYMPAKYYADIGRIPGVKLYEGEFQDAISDIEDIIAMHFAADSDVVLLAGFNFSTVPVPVDRLEQTKLRNRHGLIRTIIAAQKSVQWVAVDQTAEIDSAYASLENLTCDSMDNVLQLLN
jgi:hypothetical protein